MMQRTSVTLSAVLTFLAVPTSAAHAAWEPAAFTDEETLEILTVGPEEGEHWSTLWLVVIDGQLYVRLGTRAAERVEQSKIAPLVKLRIAGQELERVRTEPVPQMAAQVAAAMAEKYWSDVFVRHFDHPLTLRLAPESP